MTLSLTIFWGSQGDFTFVPKSAVLQKSHRFANASMTKRKDTYMTPFSIRQRFDQES
jgi:hypothetical protein